jgi:hypothetical protein
VSVPVDLDKLRAESDKFGALAYLVTVGDSGAPHVVSAAVEWEGPTIVAGAGRRTGANVGERPAVTVLWPPYEAGGYTLLVDGTGAVEGEVLRITPTKSILHRTATTDAGRRTNDCADVA